MNLAARKISHNLLKLSPFYIFLGSLIGLLAGFIVGLVANSHHLPALQSFLVHAESFGQLWSSLLAIAVLPIMSICLVQSIISLSGSGKTLRAGAIAFLAHGLIIIIALTVALSFGFWIIPHNVRVLPQWNQISPENEAAELPPAPSSPANHSRKEITWARSIVNSVGNVTKSAVLPLLALFILLGSVLNRCRERTRHKAQKLMLRIGNPTVKVLNLLLLLLPAAVFGLIAPLASATGLALVPTVVQLIAYSIGILILTTFLLHLVVFFICRIPLGRFARAILPLQFMALSTSSSLACLPVLLDTAHRRLGLSRPLSEFVLSMSVSLFRPSNAVSSPFQLLFMAHVLSVELDPVTLGVYVLGLVLLSFGSLGIPGGTTFRAMPLWLATGVPLEGYFLVKSVNPILDTFKTMLNVTEDITVTAIVARKCQRQDQEKTTAEM